MIKEAGIDEEKKETAAYHMFPFGYLRPHDMKNINIEEIRIKQSAFSLNTS